jgi:sulfatase maturation enzyme AslB (radical SAM superfamily)
MKKLFCPLPWSHLGVKNNGTLRMCSHSQSAGTGNTVLHQDGKRLYLENLDTVDVLNCETLKQVRRDFLKGEFPTQCNRCKMEKEAGYRSRDEWETLRHQEFFTPEMAYANTKEDGTLKESKILSVDLRVGNQCNLRCVMCFPGESTRWYRDYKEILQETHFGVDGVKYDLDLKNADFDWSRSEDKVASLIKAGKYIEKIKFGGGEPLMIKYCTNLVEKLVEAGYSKNIELEYSINLTIFPDKLWDLWKNFKTVKFCCSIDGPGEANEAIRYPTKWSTVVDSLKMLDDTPSNMVVFTSTTINMLSYEHWADLMLWIDAQKYKKINADVYSFSATHPVYKPQYMNIGIMEQENFNIITNKLFSKVNKSTSNQKTAMLGKIDYYKNLYNDLKFTDNVDLYRKQFATRFDRFATNQKQDWHKIFPYASSLVEKWKN